MDSTPMEEIEGLIENTRAYFKTGVTKPLQWRLNQLRILQKMLEENQEKIKNVLEEQYGGD